MKDRIETHRVDLGGGVSMFMLAARAGVRAEAKRGRAGSKSKPKLNGAHGKAPGGTAIKHR
jgi:hypothetical protein